MRDGSMCAGNGVCKKVVATVCQDGREVTAPSWYAKMTAADTVFVAQKSQNKCFCNPGWRGADCPLDYAQMPVLNMATVTTEPASADKDGKVLRAKR